MRLVTLNYSDHRREVFWNLISQFVRLSFIKSQLEQESVTKQGNDRSHPTQIKKQAQNPCFTFASVKASSSAVGGKRSL